MADQKRLRDMKIKTSVVKRLSKEKVYYQKESEQERKKLEKMKTDNTKDDHDVKKQEEVMQESMMMVPDCQRKLSAAWDELSKITKSEAELGESEEYKQSVAMLEETKESAQRA